MRAPSADAATYVPGEDAATIEHRAFMKAAWRMVPFVTIGYLLNYMDRNNVGFAALTNNRATGLTATQFGFGAAGDCDRQLLAVAVLDHRGALRNYVGTRNLLDDPDTFSYRPCRSRRSCVHQQHRDARRFRRPVRHGVVERCDRVVFRRTDGDGGSSPARDGDVLVAQDLCDSGITRSVRGRIQWRA